MIAAQVNRPHHLWVVAAGPLTDSPHLQNLTESLAWLNSEIISLQKPVCKK